MSIEVDYVTAQRQLKKQLDAVVKVLKFYYTFHIGLDFIVILFARHQAQYMGMSWIASRR